MVFMRYGIKSVTMDDIARELKISKKTLYQYVNDKADLVVKIMEAQCVTEKEVIAKAVSSAENAIDELMIISEMLAKKLQRMNPSIHYDLEKYYPDAWRVFVEHKEGFVLECVKSNLERGVGEGIYRDNLNAEIISQLYIQKIDCIFDPAIFPVGKFTFYQVYIELMRYHIRGVANRQGDEYLTDMISKRPFIL
jgi:AcrR family transcriptional regulator